MKPSLVLSCLFSSVLTSRQVRQARQATRLYTECGRAECQPATDRQTQFEFDQPQQLYLDQELESSLNNSHR